jgi:hypothetical protein
MPTSRDTTSIAALSGGNNRATIRSLYCCPYRATSVFLLKADASEAGEGWSDSQIAAALDTSLATIARTRQQLVEEGFRCCAESQTLAGVGPAAHL